MTRRVMINRTTEQQIRNIQQYYERQHGIKISTHQAIKFLLNEYNRVSRGNLK